MGNRKITTANNVYEIIAPFRSLPHIYKSSVQKQKKNVLSLKLQVYKTTKPEKASDWKPFLVKCVRSYIPDISEEAINAPNVPTA